MNKFLIMIIPLILIGCDDLNYLDSSKKEPIEEEPTRVITKVEAISVMPAEIADRTIFIIPYKGQDDTSISWSSTMNILTAELQQKGFTAVDSRGKAAYIAYFGYGIDEGETITTEYSIPRYGVTGYSGSNTRATVYGNRLSSNTTLNPSYGVTGYRSGSVTNVIFTRSIKFEIFDKKTKKPVFDASSTSRGSCHSFHPIAPYIIGSTLSDFPNGKIGDVTLDAPEISC